MKIITKAGNAGNQNFIARIFTIIAFLFFTFSFQQSQAQCYFSSLDISTATTPPPFPMVLVGGSADPSWTISFKTGVYTGVPVGSNAMVVNPLSSWGNIGTGWISDNQYDADPGVPANNTNHMTFKRDFKLCSAATVTFDFDILADNYVKYIKVDGSVVSCGSCSQPYGNYFTTAWPVYFTQALGAGAHYIEIDVWEDNNLSHNPTGMQLSGTINTPTAVIANTWSPECQDMECGCSETCYWKLGGNTIGTGTSNVFGTINNKNVDIWTNGSSRGRMTNTGLFGWNTISPTALLHVDCNGNNNTGSGLSDIRFENLETTTNSQFKTLVIDPSTGYVYNSNVSPGGSSSSSWDLNGNTTTSANWLGTKTSEDIRFFTNRTTTPTSATLTQMIIKGVQSDLPGFVGVNINNPTARFHVDCNNGNLQASGLSDIRFQNLETNSNAINVLGIDANGYVFNTGKTLPTSGGTSTAWDVSGNTPAGSKFGNLVGGSDISIYNSGATRAGVIDQMGNFGWNLGGGGGAPTTYFHVDAMGPNVPPGMSGVRLENLPTAPGTILVVDPQGYVYDSKIPAQPGPPPAPMQDMQKEINELKAQVAELQSSLAAHKISGTADPVNQLYQNTPNPFGKETQIGYNIVKMEQSAYIMVYDLNGRELMKFAADGKGKGSVTINGDKLMPGMYLYSLVIDGREADTKRMVVSK